MPEIKLATIDIVMVFVYLAVILWIGLRFAKRSKSAEDYFLAGRSLTWWLIGFSLLASNMSSSSLIGMAGEAYAMARPDHRGVFAGLLLLG